MNKEFKNILIVFLLSIVAFSVFKFVSIQKEKYDLNNRLNKAKDEITILQKEKQDILQDMEKERDINSKFEQRIAELKKYLRAGKVRITNLFANLKESGQATEELSSKISLLKIENEELQHEKERFSQEIESFKAKLNSVAELKKAIKELKKQTHKARRIEIKDSVKINKVIKGNRGYLIKNGKQTYLTDGSENTPTSHSTNLKVEVIPASGERSQTTIK